MTEENRSCALCGIEVVLDGFYLITRRGKKEFCCEGCLSIYRMLHSKELLPDTDHDN